MSDWSSYVCSSDLKIVLRMDLAQDGSRAGRLRAERLRRADSCPRVVSRHLHAAAPPLHHHVSHEPVHDLYHTRITRHGRGIDGVARQRSEEHTSEHQSLMRISYVFFCLKQQI